MIFEDERAVASLLHECSQEIGGAGEWYFKIRAQRSKSTEIRQVGQPQYVMFLFCVYSTMISIFNHFRYKSFHGLPRTLCFVRMIHFSKQE